MLAACALLFVVDVPYIKPSLVVPRAWLLGLLCMWLGAALLWGPEVMDRALTMGLLAALVCVWLMMELGRRAAVRDNGLLIWVVGAWVLAGAVSSVLGVLQYLDLAHDLSPWVNQPTKGDAFANLRQRNQFASLTSIGLVALLGWEAMDLASGRAQRSLQILRWLLLHLMAAGVACSLSRTGAVQWAVIGLLAALWAWRWAHHAGQRARNLLCMALMAPACVVLWSVVMPWIADFMTGQLGASMILRVTGQAQDYGMCAGRRVLWRNVLTLIAQHPWLGWGWGETDFAHFMTAYPTMRFCDMLDNAHDLPLHLALEFGIPFTALCLIAATRWVLRRQPWRELNPARAMAWGVLCVLGIHSLLEYPLWYGPFQMTLGLALGLLWAIPQPGLESALQAPSTRQQNVVLLMCSVLFLGCLYAANDFRRVGQIYRSPALRDAMYRDDPLLHAKQTWLFRNQAEFAELTTQTVTADNAAEIYPQALRLMHYSPEARVVKRLAESARFLGFNAQADDLERRLADVQNAASH
jgi:O-antigen ligase